MMIVIRRSDLAIHGSLHESDAVNNVSKLSLYLAHNPKNDDPLV